nr:MAG TPA: hypothetical protein [Caudoviricetes sp.]
MLVPCILASSDSIDETSISGKSYPMTTPTQDSLRADSCLRNFSRHCPSYPRHPMTKMLYFFGVLKDCKISMT